MVIIEYHRSSTKTDAVANGAVAKRVCDTMPLRFQLNRPLKKSSLRRRVVRTDRRRHQQRLRTSERVSRKRTEYTYQ